MPRAPVLALACKAECDTDHLLHKTVYESPLHARLKFHHAFDGHAHQLCTTCHQTHSSSPGSGITGMRNCEEPQTTLSSTSSSSFQMRFPAPIVALAADNTQPPQIWHGPICVLHKRMEAKKNSAECECCHQEQTVHHIIEDCPLYQPPNEPGGWDFF